MAKKRKRTTTKPNASRRAPKGWVKGTAFKIVRKGGRVTVLVRKKGRK
jgi:hypothetical protein